MDRKVEAPASVAAESEGQVVQVQAPSECHRPQSSSTARLMARRTSPKPSRAHVYLYDVEFDGELIVTASADPECDLARALLMRGVTGTIALIDGKTGEHRVTVNIEKAAKLTVRDTAREGPRFVRWKPFDPGDGPHRSDERGKS